MATAIEKLGIEFDKKMIKPLQQRFVGRQLVPVNDELSKGGIGLTSVDVLTNVNMGSGEVSYSVENFNPDTLDPTLANLMIPLLYKDYKIPARALASYKMKGVPVEGDISLLAAYNVQLQEEAMIMDGWKQDGTNYKVNGLYQSAGNDYSTSKDFGTYGNPILAVTGGMNLLEADNVFGPFNLILNPTQKNELAASTSSTGVEEWKRVEQIIGGRIITSPQVTAGTGMLCPTYDNMMPYADLINPYMMKNHLGESTTPGPKDVLGRCLEAMVIRVKQANAFCKLSSI